MRIARGLSILVVGILLGSRPAPAAPGENKPPAKVDLPADLDLVPRAAAGFVHLRLADLWQSAWVKDVRLLVDRAGPEAWKTFEKKCPLDPSILERMTVILLTPQTLNDPFPTVDPEAVSAVVVVRTKNPYSRLALMQSLSSREKIYRNNLYYFSEELWSGLVLVDEHTFLIGSEDALVRYFDMTRRPNPTGPLQEALVEATGKHQVVVGLNAQLIGKEKEPALPFLQKLLTAHASILTLDLDKGIRLGVRLNYQNEEQAKAGEIGLRDTLNMGRQGLAMPIAELEQEMKNPDKTGPSRVFESFSMLVGLGFLRELDAILKEAPIERQGQVVRMPLEYRRLESAQLLFVFSMVGMGSFASSTFDFVGDGIGKKEGEKDPIEEQLKNLATAMEKYHDKHGSYPPQSLHDAEGRPVLSWRVALLPYLGEDALYNEFKLDEPWDSLHNKRLIKKLPKALQPVTYRRRGAGRGAGRGKTTAQVFVGENAIFGGKKSVGKKDVAGHTILLAYLGGEGVYWTKPADLSYAAEKPLPELFGKRGHDQIKVLLKDGTFRSIERDLDEKSLRALIERQEKKKLPKE